MKLSEMNEEQRNRTKESKKRKHLIPRRNNSSITSTNILMVELQNSPTTMSPHIEENADISDKIPPMKTQGRSVIPHTRMTAGFKSDTNNISNESDQTIPKENLKSPSPLTPKKRLIKKTSTVKVTPEKLIKSVEETNCVPQATTSLKKMKDNSTKT